MADIELDSLIVRDFTKVSSEVFKQAVESGEIGENDLNFTKFMPASLWLFYSAWADHEVDDMSWLRADTFSWQSGDVYKAAYEHLANDLHLAYSDPADPVKVDVIGDIPITYVLTPDGHKICLPSQESNLIALYEATGVAWYYILDEDNKQFKLPRTKYGFTGLRDSVGGYVAPGLPSIEHTHTVSGYGNNSSGNNSVFVQENGNDYVQLNSTTNTAVSPIYGASDTVQPAATQMYLYFYVGNFEQDAVEQTAGINAELFNKKIDLPANKTQADVDFVIASQLPTADNGYTWYRKYKSGWLEQGGKLSGRSVVFPYAFSQVPTVCIGTIDSDADSVSSVTINNVTTTGFSGLKTSGNKDWDSGSLNMSGYWTAFGIAE